MAEKDKKYPDNIPGKYYVDDKCIACDACVGEAPKNFVMNNNEGHSKVSKQPESPEEEAACKAAMSACPVEAIGDDGN
jgi:ferredoxin